MPRLALLEIPLVFNNTTGNLQNLEGKHTQSKHKCGYALLHTLVKLF